MKIIKSALKLTLFLLIVCGLIYPLTVTGISQLIAKDKANGSLITLKGEVIGSELLAQDFKDDKYFKGRYQGEANTPISELNLDERKAKSPWKDVENVPEELLTNSGSDLDPHISVEAAKFQVPYVAKASGISTDKLYNLIDSQTEKKFLGLGTEKINVLKINVEIYEMIN